MEREHPPRTLLGTAARGSSLTFMGAVIDKGLFFVIRVIVSRLFGAKYFGLLVIGMMISEFAVILGSIGLPKGGMRFLSVAIGSRDFEKIPKIFGTALSIPFFLSAGLSIALFFLAETLSIAWFHNAELIPVFRVLAISIPFATIVKVGLDLSRGFNTTRYAVFVENLFAPVANIAIFFLFYAFYRNFNSILYAMVAASLLSALLIIWFLQKQTRALMGGEGGAIRFLKDFTLAGDREYIIYSIPLFLTGFTAVLLHSIDIFMLGRFLDETYVGIYAAASLFATSFLSALLLKSMNSIFGPLIATQYGEKAVDKIGYLYIATTRWLFYISLAFSLFSIIARREIMLIFGKSFLIDGPAVLVILLVGNMVNCLTGGVGYILSMTGHQKKELATNVITIVLNVLLNLILIPRYGIIGAAVATASSQLLVNALRVFMVYKIFKVQPFTMKLMKLFIVGAGIVSLSFILNSLFPSKDYNLLFAVVSLPAIIAVIRSAGLERDDMEVIKGMLWRFNRRPGRVNIYGKE